MVVIIANSTLMATTHYGAPESMASAVEALNYSFTCAYALEFGLKVRRPLPLHSSDLCWLSSRNALGCLQQVGKTAVELTVNLEPRSPTWRTFALRTLQSCTAWWAWLAQLLAEQLEQV
jgi:hypothetical protein